MPSKNAVKLSKKLLSFIIFVALVVGFAAGARERQLLAAVAPVFGIKIEAGTLDLDSVQHTYQELKANFDGQLDNAKLIAGANRGLVAAAGDKYTVYFDSKEANDFNKDLSGDIGGGIGAEISVRKGQPTIIRILDGNPAEAAGLKKGDVITTVNDKSADGWSADKAADALRGEPGTTVSLTVKRGSQSKHFSLTRAVVNNPSVNGRIENGVGILTISRFDTQTGTLARQQAESFKKAGVHGVIVDLRSDGGGYLQAAADVASLWLDDKLVVTQKTGGKVTDELRSNDDPVLDGIKTVVLINGGSASASEILAGALQDYGVATLLGEQSFGKGTVQDVIKMDNNALLKVTVARWYTPKGTNVTDKGLTPNVLVKLTATDSNAGRDPQLAAALKGLQ